MSEVRLLTYRHVWTERDRNGDWQYKYHCTWSDGTSGLVDGLRWDRVPEAVELPMTDLKNLEEELSHDGTLL